MMISLEGVDGAGKSSHIQAITEYLERAGREVVATREPGGTPLGEELRHMLLNGNDMHVETETLLMFAARREHLEQVIRPALADNKVVLVDRFTDSTFAFQVSRGLARSKFMELEKWATQGQQPNLTLLFDLETDIAQQRIEAARGGKDRFESMDVDYHRTVRQLYLERASAAPERIVVIDSSEPIECVRERALCAVGIRLESPVIQPGGIDIATQARASLSR